MNTFERPRTSVFDVVPPHATGEARPALFIEQEMLHSSFKKDKKHKSDGETVVIIEAYESPKASSEEPREHATTTLAKTFNKSALLTMVLGALLPAYNIAISGSYGGMLMLSPLGQLSLMVAAGAAVVWFMTAYGIARSEDKPKRRYKKNRRYEEDGEEEERGWR